MVLGTEGGATLRLTGPSNNEARRGAEGVVRLEEEIKDYGDGDGGPKEEGAEEARGEK